jgi:geranylgeranyl diphosphate synthase type I
MEQNKSTQIMLRSIEDELKCQLSRLDRRSSIPFLEILTYHMGWTGDGAGPGTRGKRIRSLLVLLVTTACGHDWHSSLPAASAVELIHNFSLIHDDIEDGSTTRRGRTTVWEKWGIPMAINAGDALFSLANLSMMDLLSFHPQEMVLKASNFLFSSCLNLTHGQFLDMDYQEKDAITLDDYWEMIEGKTASLISTTCVLGALLGGADNETIEHYKKFGLNLGLAFQIQDDYLGIWGEEEITGKSATSDILNKKKTFPVIFCLEKGGKFSEQWKTDYEILSDRQKLITLLEEEGSLTYTQETIRHLTSLAFEYLYKANPQEPSRSELSHILKDLEGRNK